MTEKIHELWLKYALDDLNSAEVLMKADIFNMVCFHSQQTVEKLFKAIIASHDQPIPRIHNLIRLNRICEDLVSEKMDLDEDMLLFLNDIYIDSRYPADFGLLPQGRPDQNDAQKALEYANIIDKKIRKIISR